MPNSNANDLDLKRIQAYYSGTLIEEFRHTKINDLVQQYWDLLPDDDFFDKDQDPLHKEDPGQLFCFLDLDDESTLEQWVERHAIHYLGDKYQDQATLSDAGSWSASRSSSRSSSRPRHASSSPPASESHPHTNAPQYGLLLAPTHLGIRSRSPSPRPTSIASVASSVRSLSIRSDRPITMHDIERSDAGADSWVTCCAEHLTREFIYGPKTIRWAWSLQTKALRAHPEKVRRVYESLNADAKQSRLYKHAKRWTRMSYLAQYCVLHELINNPKFIIHNHSEKYNIDEQHQLALDERIYRSQIAPYWTKILEASTFPLSKAPHWHPRISSDLANVYNMYCQLGGPLKVIHDHFFEYLMTQVYKDVEGCAGRAPSRSPNPHEAAWALAIEQHVAKQLCHEVYMYEQPQDHAERTMNHLLVQTPDVDGERLLEVRHNSWSKFLEDNFFTPAGKRHLSMGWNELWAASAEGLERAKKEIEDLHKSPSAESSQKKLTERVCVASLTEDFRYWFITMRLAENPKERAAHQRFTQDWSHDPRKQYEIKMQQFRDRNFMFNSWQVHRKKTLKACQRTARGMCSAPLGRRSRDPSRHHEFEPAIDGSQASGQVHANHPAGQSHAHQVAPHHESPPRPATPGEAQQGTQPGHPHISISSPKEAHDRIGRSPISPDNAKKRTRSAVSAHDGNGRPRTSPNDSKSRSRSAVPGGPSR